MLPQSETLAADSYFREQRYQVQGGAASRVRRELRKSENNTESNKSLQKGSSLSAHEGRPDSTDVGRMEGCSLSLSLSSLATLRCAALGLAVTPTFPDRPVWTSRLEESNHCLQRYCLVLDTLMEARGRASHQHRC